MSSPPRITALAAMLTVAANAVGPVVLTVRTSSMEPTFLDGDHVLATIGDPVSELHRGDVIAFYYPPEPKVIFVKRLIGLPGDHIHFKSGSLVLNSKTISEPYVRHSGGPDASLFLNNFPSYRDKGGGFVSPEGRQMLDLYAKSGELIIPEGRYFVLGDNRDDSLDSRLWGFLEASHIIGRVHEIVSSDDPKTRTPRVDRVHLQIQRGSLK